MGEMGKLMMMMKKQAVSLIKHIHIVIIVVFAIIITFANEVFPNYSSEYYKHKKKYNIIIKERESNLEKLVLGTSLEEEYYLITKKTNTKLQEYTRVKNKMKKEASVLGYGTLKRMFLTIGFPIFGLIISFLLYFYVYNSENHNKYKKLYLRISTSFLLTSAYWVSWSLLWFKINGKYDIPDTYLYITFSIISISIVFIYKAFLKYLNNEDDILKKKIRELIGFIAFSRENIVKKLAIKAGDNNDKEVETIINSYDDEMWNTLKKTAE